MTWVLGSSSIRDERTEIETDGGPCEKRFTGEAV